MSESRSFNAMVYEAGSSTETHRVRIVRSVEGPNGVTYYDADGSAYTHRPGGGLGVIPLAPEVKS